MVRFITDSRKPGTTLNQPLLVIGAGLPRAATSSMQAAFEELGFAPCLHMANILPHPYKERVMIEAIKENDAARRYKLLHQLVDGHQAICDLPVVCFAADLMDMYPEAKIVLNGRQNADIWAKSCRESLGFFFTLRFKLTGLLWPADRHWYELNMEVVKWLQRKFGGPKNIMTAEMYEMYYVDIRKQCANRGKEVLEFKAEDGWDPLCKFLGKPLPSKPFPKANEKIVFAIVKAIIVTRGLLLWSVLGATIWVAWHFRRLTVNTVDSLLR